MNKNCKIYVKKMFLLFLSSSISLKYENPKVMPLCPLKRNARALNVTGREPGQGCSPYPGPRLPFNQPMTALTQKMSHMRRFHIFTEQAVWGYVYHTPYGCLLIVLYL